jgi:hypothetical protein
LYFGAAADAVWAGSGPQQLIDVFSVMRCEGWSLAIDIAVKSDRTPVVGSVGGGGAGAGSSTTASAGVASPLLGGSSAATGLAASAAAASCWHYFQPYNLPHAFIGEFQIKYIIDMVDTLVNSSAVVKLSRKLKPYYVRDRRPEAAAAAKAVAAVRAQVLACILSQGCSCCCLILRLLLPPSSAYDVTGAACRAKYGCM